MLLTKIAVGMAVVYVIWLLWKRLKRGRNSPPLIGAWLPYIGCGAQYNNKGPAFLLECQKNYGDVFTLYMGGMDFTFVLDDNTFADKYEASFLFSLIAFTCWCLRF
jgi:hypothetical protein